MSKWVSAIAPRSRRSIHDAAIQLLTAKNAMTDKQGFVLWLILVVYCAYGLVLMNYVVWGVDTKIERELKGQ